LTAVSSPPSLPLPPRLQISLPRDGVLDPAPRCWKAVRLGARSNQASRVSLLYDAVQKSNICSERTRTACGSEHDPREFWISTQARRPRARDLEPSSATTGFFMSVPIAAHAPFTPLRVLEPLTSRMPPPPQQYALR
jgi:hypothetical protein